jgi:hypothetical protein
MFPVGSVCVLKEEKGDGYRVVVCRGADGQELLKQCETLEDAKEFAIEARQERLSHGGSLDLHFPDDCPCYVKIASD